MTGHCPITLQPVENGGLYSKTGLRSLHPRLERLEPLPLSWEEQLREALGEQAVA